MADKRLGRRNAALLQSSELDLSSGCEPTTHDALISQAPAADQRLRSIRVCADPDFEAMKACDAAKARAHLHDLDGL